MVSIEPLRAIALQVLADVVESGEDAGAGGEIN